MNGFFLRVALIAERQNRGLTRFVAECKSQENYPNKSEKSVHIQISGVAPIADYEAKLSKFLKGKSEHYHISVFGITYSGMFMITYIQRHEGILNHVVYEMQIESVGRFDISKNTKQKVK